ncbi:fungal pheromone mating factor STE2 GPCR-domain-containing protein [Hypoxylon sp. FL1150]|nr:fungal pheromone mating factor STE2 GPCR-domain-containing protein [Hypoxylon sp. FL1150]
MASETDTETLLFDPRTQNFTILGRPGSPSDPPPVITVSFSVIDAQRVRLANTSINYGVQLGLILLSLLVTLLLLPSRKLRRGVHVAQVSCLVVSVARLVLLVLYFPGPLAEYYVAWTRDAGVLRASEYAVTTASAALGVVQLALVEASLALQSRVLVRTWGASGCRPGSRSRTSPSSSSSSSSSKDKKCWWRPPVLALAVLLAAASVGVRAVWVAHYTRALRGHTLPVPLDAWGRAAVTIGAVSVFYFCGVFFAHLVLHLAATRRVLRHDGRRLRKFSVTLSLGGGKEGGGGLTSLEILAVGNGILMLAPCLFAGLDIAAGPGNTRVLPFDAGSWVQTLVAAGLPLISIAAHYRGSDSADSRLNSRVNWLRRTGRGARWWPENAGSIVINTNKQQQRDNRPDDSSFDGTLSFSFPPHAARRGSSRVGDEDVDVATLTRSSGSHPTENSSFAVPAEPSKTRSWSWRGPADEKDVEDLEAGMSSTEIMTESEYYRERERTAGVLNT